MYKRTSELYGLPVRVTSPDRNGSNVAWEYRNVAVGETHDGRKVVGMVDRWVDDYITHMAYELCDDLIDTVRQKEVWYFDAGSSCPEIAASAADFLVAIEKLR